MPQEQKESIDAVENGLALWFLSKDEERLIENLEKLPISYRKVIIELTELVADLQG